MHIYYKTKPGTISDFVLWTLRQHATEKSAASKFPEITKNLTDSQLGAYPRLGHRAAKNLQEMLTGYIYIYNIYIHHVYMYIYIYIMHMYI